MFKASSIHCLHSLEHLASLSLNFCTCEMGLVMAPPHEDCSAILRNTV